MKYSASAIRRAIADLEKDGIPALKIFQAIESAAIDAAISGPEKGQREVSVSLDELIKRTGTVLDKKALDKFVRALNQTH